MDDDIAIRYAGVQKRLGRQQVLRGVDLEIRRGECLVVIGRSGGGKSVLLKHLIGLMKPDSGRIEVDGQDVVPLSEVELVPIRKKIGIVFQGGALFDSLTVEANLAFPLREERGTPAAEITDRVREALDAVGMLGHEKKMPGELSGGMRKRVAFARAIIRKPEVVLYDEPTTGLDPIMADSIDQLIVKMRERYGVTSIVVTHDMHSAYTIAHRIAMLHEGRIYTVDTPDHMRQSADPIIHKFVNGISADVTDL
ncbi:MAG TPA: ABC transporter ATP-binding protein [Verrucomicrobiae bacterium]|nr:ABC transporter ATP-binding protein [Verrucomicrobiae bacterium]